MPVLIAACIAIASTAMVFTLLSRPRSGVRARLEQFKDLAAAAGLEQPDQERPPSFMERVGRPFAMAAMRVFSRVLPASLGERLRWRLTQAGDPMAFQAFVTMWLAAALLLPVGYILLVSAGPAPMGTQQKLIVLAMLALGSYGPHLWLKRKKQQRQKAILKSLPDAIDLLTTSVEAGLGIDGALGQVANKVRGPLAPELRRVLREMAVGSTRKEALQALAARVEIPDVDQFINALIQAEQMGVSLAHVVRVQSDQMRIKRKQRAEQQAYKAPVKMVFPLVLFIFPAIFVVILGPAVIQMMENFGG